MTNPYGNLHVYTGEVKPHATRSNPGQSDAIYAINLFFDVLLFPIGTSFILHRE